MSGVRKPEDHGERLRAIHQDVTFIDAPAGSGKTETIVLRVVRHAVVDPDPIDVERIGLATFTLAAAAELKARVREVIEDVVEWSADPDDARWTGSGISALRIQALLSEVSPDEASRIGDRARVALRHLDVAPWGTLHSMCRTVIEASLHAQRIPAAAVIRDNYEAELAKHLAAESFASRLADPSSFSDLLDIPDATSPARVLRDMGLSVSRPSAIAEEVHASVVGQNGLDDRLSARSRELAALIADERVAIVDDARRLVDDSGVFTSHTADRPSVALARSFAEAGCPPLVRNDYTAFLAAVLLAESRPDLWSVIDTFIGTTINRRSALTLQCDAAEYSFVNAGDELELTPPTSLEDSLARPVVALSKRIKAADSRQFATARLLDLALELGRDAHTDRTTRGRLAFDDLIALAAQSLGDTSPEASPLDLLIVDEVQDNDPLQHTLLQAFEALGVPVVVVGDARQSIYGFRGAQPALFVERLQAQDPTRLASLSVTFRHELDLTAALNAIFAAPVDVAGVSAPESTAHRRPLESGVPAVTVQVGAGARSAPERRREAARLVCDRIADLHQQGIGLGDIAVLSRARTSWPALRQELASRGLPYLVQSAEQAWDTPGARGLVSLLRWCAGRQSLDRGAALASPWFGVDLATLAELDRPTEQRSAQLTNLLNRLDAIPSISMGSAADAVWSVLRSIDAWGVIRALAQRRRDLADELFADLRFVIDEAERFSESEGQGLREFLASVVDGGDAGAEDRTRPATGGERRDAVTITTIHNAKGLEFPNVILTGLEDPPRSDSVSLLWPTNPADVLKGRVEKTKSWIAAGTGLDADSVKDELERRKAEEGDRLLYVALTRAENTATVIHVQEPPRGKNSEGDAEWDLDAAVRAWWSKGAKPKGGRLDDTFVARLRALVPEGEDATVVPATLVDATIRIEVVVPREDVSEVVPEPLTEWTPTPSRIDVSVRPTRTGSRYEKHVYRPTSTDADLSIDDPDDGAEREVTTGDVAAEAPMDETRAGDFAMEVKSGRVFGTAVHHAVQLLLLRHPDRVVDSAAGEQMARVVCAGTDLSVAAVAEAAIRVLTSPELGGGRIEAEYPVLVPMTDEDGNEVMGGGIIDLVVFHDDHTELFDIKTDVAQEGDVDSLVTKYQPQLAMYGRALELAGAPRVTRAGLLSTSLQGLDGSARFIPVVVS